MQVVIMVGRDLDLLNVPKVDLCFPEAYKHPSKVWPYVEGVIRFIGTCPNADRPVRIATHSEALVDAIGNAIYNKSTAHQFTWELWEVPEKLGPDKWGVPAPVTQGKFNPDTGVPEGWPAGFFSTGL